MGGHQCRKLLLLFYYYYLKFFPKGEGAGGSPPGDGALGNFDLTCTETQLCPIHTHHLPFQSQKSVQTPSNLTEKITAHPLLTK